MDINEAREILKVSFANLPEEGKRNLKWHAVNGTRILTGTRESEIKFVHEGFA